MFKLFRHLSTSDWNNFISARGNLPEIISDADCSSSIFSNVFGVAEKKFEIIWAAGIILFQLQTRLRVKQNTEINIAKLFQNNFISRVTAV